MVIMSHAIDLMELNIVTWDVCAILNDPMLSDLICCKWHDVT